MDDEQVVLDFIANVEEAVASVGELRDTAAELAASAEEAKTGLDGLRDSSEETALALEGAREGADALRDGAMEAAAELRALRDDAIEASAALHGVRDAEVEAGAAGAAEGAGGLSVMALAITALVGAAAAVAPAAVAMGAGIGAFALFAIPTIKGVSSAITQINADQQAYNRALTATARNNALKHLQQDWAGLSPPVRMVVQEVQNLEAQWKSISQQFAMPTANLMSQAIGIVSDLLPRLVPLAQAGFGAVSQVLDAINAGISSPAFAQFLQFLTQVAGPATTALIRLAGTIGGILVQALEQLAPVSVPFIEMLTKLLAAAGPALIGALRFIAQVVMDIGKAITPVLPLLGKFFGYLNDHPVFAQIVAGIIGIVAAVKLFQGVMSMVSVLSNPWVLLAVVIAVLALLIITHTHQIAEAFDLVRHTIASWGHDIASAFDLVRHDVARVAHDIAAAFDTARHEVARAADGIRNAVVSAFTRVIDMVKNDWKNVVGWLVLPVLMAAGEIYTHARDIAQTFDRLRHDAAAALDGLVHDALARFDQLRHDTASAFDATRHAIAATVDAIPGYVRQRWDQLRHDAAAFGDGLLHDVTSIFTAVWHYVTSTTSSGASQLLGIFQRLPGEIIGFLEQLPGDMVTMGVNIVEGMIRGVESMGSSLINAIESIIPGPIKSLMSAAFNMASPSRLFHQYGIFLVQGLINGVREMQPHLQAAMHAMAGVVSAAGSSAAQGASAYAASAIAPAGSMTHNVNVTVNAQGTVGVNYNDPRYEQMLQAAVQEATLRYHQLNGNDGLTPLWGR